MPSSTQNILEMLHKIEADNCFHVVVANWLNQLLKFLANNQNVILESEKRKVLKILLLNYYLN